MALGGVKGEEELSDSVWTIAKSRFPWLSVNLATAFLSSIVIGNGINFGVIWLARYVAARRRALPLDAALAEAVWGALPGTLVAAVAAAPAYASLTITGFRGFRQ